MQDLLFWLPACTGLSRMRTLQHCDSFSPVPQCHVTYDPPPNICVSPGDTGAQGRRAPLRAPISSCPVFLQGAAGKHILDNSRAQIQPSSVIRWFSAQTTRNISTYLNCRQIKRGLVRLHFPSLILCCLLWGQREGHKEGSCKNLHVPL